MHRQELLVHTHRPVLHQIRFAPSYIWGSGFSQTLGVLLDSWRKLDIESDPYVKRLRKDPESAERLQRVIQTRKTNCHMTLKKFIARSCHIREELGPWAADYFIHASIQLIQEAAADLVAQNEWDLEEKEFMVDFFSKIPMPDATDAENYLISSKLRKLIEFLKDVDSPEFAGLVFVEQRATVGVLANLLSVHPETRTRFRCAPYIGWANNSNRKDMLGDLTSVNDQHDTLAEFRAGRKNLIITTNVLEEGIDVTACSLVVCFNKPPNLKSFIQRRGRARQKKSTYAIMFATDDTSVELRKWAALEEAMVAAYQSEERQLRQLQQLEMTDEQVRDTLSIKSTG